MRGAPGARRPSVSFTAAGNGAATQAGKGARGRCGLCVGHGGGRRCAWRGPDGNGPPCSKGAQGRTPFCMAHGRPSLQRPRLPQGFCGPAETCLQGAHNLGGKGRQTFATLPQKGPQGRLWVQRPGQAAATLRRAGEPAARPTGAARVGRRAPPAAWGHDYLGRDRLASASASVPTDLLPLGAGAQPVAGRLMPPYGDAAVDGRGVSSGLTPELAQLAAGHSTGFSRAAGLPDPYAAATMGRGLTPAAAAALGAHALGTRPFGGSMLQPGANASTGVRSCLRTPRQDPCVPAADARGHGVCCDPALAAKAAVETRTIITATFNSSSFRRCGHSSNSFKKNVCG